MSSTCGYEWAGQEGPCIDHSPNSLTALFERRKVLKPASQVRLFHYY